MNVVKELAQLERMTVTDLKRKYEEVFGERCRSGHKQWLIKRIIWRLQANAEGDLTERARRRALELSNDADLRMKAPPQPKAVRTPSPQRRVTHQIATSHDPRLPMPGAVLVREYKGREIHVTVLADGFEHEGEKYQSLSAVAKAITGSHCNGFLFFRLNGKGGRK